VNTQLESLLDLVSPRVGIVRSLSLRVKSADEPELPFIYDAFLSHFDFRKGDKTGHGSCGKGLTEEDAMLGALGEAVERYCASHAAMKRTRRAAMQQLSGEAISPLDFVLYSDSQYARSDFPFRPWQPHDELLWAEMNELGSEARAWVPAAFVYLNSPSDQNQDFICTSNSSGFAAGPDLKLAIRSAALELLERDAFVITWLNSLAVPEIDFVHVEGIIGDIRSTYQREGAELRAFLLATDLPVAVVMALVVDWTGGGPAAMIGLGCEFDRRTALRKALFEVCQLHELLRRKHEEGAAKRLNSYADVATMEEHAAYFLRQDHLFEFDFLLHPGPKVGIDDQCSLPVATVDEDLKTLQSALAASGCRVFYRDLTTPDLEAYPVRVARVLITHLQPLHFGYGMQRLGGRRLYELPMKLGFRDTASSEATLNPCPHPLA
jgi:ribosomal protein S12 methylthiotransferase accessory factor